jgi:hypothetical protein
MIIEPDAYERGLRKLNSAKLLTDEEKAAVKERGMPYRYPTNPIQDTYGQSVCVSDGCFGLGE